MTEAWGAIVAAVAAGVFGIGGAFVGLFVGRRQTIDQAQVEHGQWLRGQRREAYVAYLSAWDAAETALIMLVFDLRKHVDPSNYTEGQFERERRTFFANSTGEAMFPVMAKLEAVQLLGPVDVAEAAHQMESALGAAATEIGAYGLHASTPDGCTAKQSEFNAMLANAGTSRNRFFEQAKLIIATPPKPQD
ncbi:hypothetical protein ACIRBZ_13855 [Streptomyces sp. NPDC094038]|uniref:hypothetical protein n=1 Tax=Streptomyces sp. NPDC094038 TaxID=3366055 RepID=UPI003811D457